MSDFTRLELPRKIAHRPAEVRAVVRAMPRRPGGGPRRRSSFVAAETDRLNQDWLGMSGQQFDQVIRPHLPLLRRRSRGLVANEPYARNFIGLVGDNIVGPEGFKYQPRIMRADGTTLDRETNRRLALAWEEFCEPSNCDVEGKRSLPELLRDHVMAVATDGEGLIRLWPAFPNSAHRFALQLLDADLLDLDFTRPAGGGVNEIRMGVEKDAWGRDVAYHLWDRHPQEYMSQRTRIRVPAEELLHRFTHLRVTQTRGVPWLLAAMLPLWKLDRYQNAELTAARTAATKMGFLETDPEHGPWEEDTDADGEPIHMEAEEGVIEQLPPGLKFVGWNPEHPVAAFDPFTRAVLRGACAGARGSYSSVTGDLSQTSYASSRTGTLQERDVWRTLQAWVVRQTVRPIHRHWLEYSLMSGALDLPALESRTYWPCRFQPRGWKWVDPEKDGRASQMAIAEGWTSRQRVCAEQGEDFFEIMEELAAEKEAAKALGLELGQQLLPTPKGASDGKDSDAGDEKPGKSDDGDAAAAEGDSSGRGRDGGSGEPGSEDRRGRPGPHRDLIRVEG